MTATLAIRARELGIGRVGVLLRGLLDTAPGSAPAAVLGERAGFASKARGAA